MRIGIHKRKGSFSENWIKYCEAHQIEYKIVNAYDSDIIQQLKDCDAFMWHHHHAIVSDLLFAKQYPILFVNDVISPYINFSAAFNLLSYLIVAGITA